jgi:hypothetical protein
MPGAFSGQGAVLLKDGRVLLIKGSAAWLYDPKSGTFSVTGSPACCGSLVLHVGLLPDGRTFYMPEGGTAEKAANFELYDPNSGTFIDTQREVSAPPFSTTAVLKDGRLLIAGGQGDGGNRAYIYTP